MKLKKNIVSKKVFSYKKGNCNLNFSLGIDNDSELKDFRDCLVEAKKDIDNILKGMED